MVLPLLTPAALAATSSTSPDGVVVLYSSLPGGGVEAGAGVIVDDGLAGESGRNHPDFVWLPIRASVDVSSDRKDAEAETALVVEAGGHELGHTLGFRHEHTRPES